jgi:hypothetical protein
MLVWAREMAVGNKMKLRIKKYLQKKFISDLILG